MQSKIYGLFGLMKHIKNVIIVFIQLGLNSDMELTYIIVKKTFYSFSVYFSLRSH